MVSVITPVYNAEKFIKETIESVINQTYKDWEMILVDDCSTDSSFEIISDYAKKYPNIKVFKNDKNSGPVDTRNFAIEKSSGRYLAMLDSDDLWKPEKLKKQISFMEEKNVYFSYSGYEIINENGKLLKSYTPPLKATYKNSLLESFIGCLTVILDTEVLGKRFFKKTLMGAEDSILWLSILREGFEAYGLKDNLASYRVVASSRSRNKFIAAKERWYVLRHVENLNFFKAFRCFFHYAVTSFLKNGIKSLF